MWSLIGTNTLNQYCAGEFMHQPDFERKYKEVHEKQIYEWVKTNVISLKQFKMWVDFSKKSSYSRGYDDALCSYYHD